MSSRAVQLAIDARPRGPHGPMAVERLQGRSVLSHVLDLAGELTTPGQAILIHARVEDHGRLSELAEQAHTGPIAFVTGPPRADAAILRTDRFYDRSRLRRRVRTGRSPEGAVIWRLDRQETFQSADEEITRRLTYQPLGKYWAFPLARRIADWLAATQVTPNMLTLAAAALMMASAALIACGAKSPVALGLTAVAMASALVLDTADGRLARSQGTSSSFGRWLDQVLDEAADVTLHAAIAWAAFASSGWWGWLMIGMAYASGKYMFLVQSLLGDELERAGRQTSGPTASQVVPAELTLSPSMNRRVWHFATRLGRTLGHADLRWHLWILLAALGRLEAALVLYAVYFPARTVAGILKKVVRHG